MCVAQVPQLAAGSGADPLELHFPFGLGVDGSLAFYQAGGMYPVPAEISAESAPAAAVAASS